MLRRTRSQNVYRISNGSPRKELAFQLFGKLAFQLRHIQPAFTQGIGQHHTRSARMGNNGKVLSFQFRQSENTPYRSQFLPGIATYDTRFTEQSLHRRIGTGDSSRMRGCRTTAALTAARFNGRNLASLLYQRRSMEQQSVRIAYTFDIKQFYLGVFFRIEMLVHILQHIFYSDLLGIAHRPYGIELQPFCNRTLQNKHRSRSGAGYQIDALRMQIGDGLTEHAMMPRIHQSDTIGSYQRSAVPIRRFQNTVFQKRALMRFLTKSGRKDNERTYPLLRSKQLYRIGTKNGGNSKDSKVRIGNILYIGIGLYALHFSLFRIHRPQFSGITAMNQILQDSPAGFMYIVGSSHHHNTGRMQQLACYHSLFILV